MNRPHVDNETVDMACVNNKTEIIRNDEIDYEFMWTDSQEMLMLGCYYYGYVATHILGISVNPFISRSQGFFYLSIYP